MATTTINLTDAIVRHAEPTGTRDFICDSKEAGLQLQITPNGVNTFIVQRVLTHKSIQSTQVYVNLNVEDLRNPVNTTIRNMQSYCLQQNQV